MAHPTEADSHAVRHVTGRLIDCQSFRTGAEKLAGWVE